MRKEDLWLVEFTLQTNTLKDFKITPNKPENKIGAFHLWKVERKAYANEFFVGLIEDYLTGELYQVRVQNIRFLSDKESEYYLKNNALNSNSDNEGNIWK